MEAESLLSFLTPLRGHRNVDHVRPLRAPRLGKDIGQVKRVHKPDGQQPEHLLGAPGHVPVARDDGCEGAHDVGQAVVRNRAAARSHRGVRALQGGVHVRRTHGQERLYNEG